MGSYLAVVAIVFAVNLLPAFGPPTWMLLVLFRLNWELNPVGLVIAGALAAGSGRYLLGWLSYRLRNHIGEHRRANLEAARAYLTQHRSGSVMGIALFALSPLPSAQLFEAAGVLGLPLRPLTLAFFSGRLVSYSLYVAGATAAQHTFGDALTFEFTSPLGIALEVGMLVLVVALAQIPWARVLPAHHSASAPTPPGTTAPSSSSTVPPSSPSSPTTGTSSPPSAPTSPASGPEQERPNLEG